MCCEEGSGREWGTRYGLRKGEGSLDCESGERGSRGGLEGPLPHLALPTLAGGCSSPGGRECSQRSRGGGGAAPAPQCTPPPLRAVSPYPNIPV
eukprot:1196164-Prorocentrum_minimum.AAC.2